MIALILAALVGVVAGAILSLLWRVRIERPVYTTSTVEVVSAQRDKHGTDIIKAYRRRAERRLRYIQELEDAHRRKNSYLREMRAELQTAKMRELQAQAAT